MEHPFLIEKTF